MNMKVKIKLTILTILLATFFSVNLASAQIIQDEVRRDITTQDDAFLKEAGLGTQSLSLVVSQIIKILLSFLGVIFIILIVYAGFVWMTSAGNDDKIRKAKATMAAAIVGLAVVLAAYIVTYFVIDQLLEATKGGQGLD